MKNCLVSVVLLGAAAVASAEPVGKDLHWSTSWYAAPQPAWDASFVLPTQLPGAFDRQTLQEKVRLSTGGPRVDLARRGGEQRRPAHARSNPERIDRDDLAAGANAC